MDYYPSATLIHGPVWKNPLQLLPVASVLEENYPVIREELEAILKARPKRAFKSENKKMVWVQIGKQHV
jgi:hypothetical protein